MDESALLQAARKLDKEGLTIIFDTYAPALYRYALRLCRDPLDSDNVVGDTFSKFLEHCAAGRGPVTNLKSYLFQIAYHLMIDRIRQDRRVISLDVMSESFVPVTSSAQVQLEERERIDALLTALHSELSGLQRHVILLRFLEGFSLKETAFIVGKNISSIKVIQHRGIARLRKCLQLDPENNEPDQELKDLLE